VPKHSANTVSSVHSVMDLVDRLNLQEQQLQQDVLHASGRDAIPRTASPTASSTGSPTGSPATGRASGRSRPAATAAGPRVTPVYSYALTPQADGSAGGAEASVTSDPGRASGAGGVSGTARATGSAGAAGSAATGTAATGAGQAGAATNASPSGAPTMPASPEDLVERMVSGLSPASSALVSTQSATFADVMSRLQQSIDYPAVAPTPAAWVPGLLVGPAAPHQTTPAHPRPVPAPAPVSAEVPAPRTILGSPLLTGAEMAARATRMGVPGKVLAGIKDPADVYRRLLAWVESRPMAPMVVSTQGQVIVVVGEVTAALGVAGSLARELRVNPAGIHLAVPASSSGHAIPVGRLLSDVSDIAIRRQRWQHSVSSTIVVVEASLPPGAPGWLAAVVSALAPTFTWAVAQASTKVNDVVSWATLIGHVDALALVNVPVTGDPASALAGPLPVGLLDGQRATVTRWMAMLTDEDEPT
jgi:hypothetical protein